MTKQDVHPAAGSFGAKRAGAGDRIQRRRRPASAAAVLLVLALALVPKLGEGSVYLMRAESPGPIKSKLTPRVGVGQWRDQWRQRHGFRPQQFHHP